MQLATNYTCILISSTYHVLHKREYTCQMTKVSSSSFCLCSIDASSSIPVRLKSTAAHQAAVPVLFFTGVHLSTMMHKILGISSGYSSTTKAGFDLLYSPSVDHRPTFISTHLVLQFQLRERDVRRRGVCAQI